LHEKTALRCSPRQPLLIHGRISACCVIESCLLEDVSVVKVKQRVVSSISQHLPLLASKLASYLPSRTS
jgi:hypothetical protein